MKRSLKSAKIQPASSGASVSREKDDKAAAHNKQRLIKLVISLLTIGLLLFATFGLTRYTSKAGRGDLGERKGEKVVSSAAKNSAVRLNELKLKLVSLSVATSEAHEALAMRKKMNDESPAEDLKAKLADGSADLINISKELLPLLFGPPPYTINVKLALGDVDLGHIMLEMAHDEMPYTSLFFLRQVEAQLWDNQKIIRNAGHVIQADPRGPPGRKRFKDLGLSSVAFQEYSENFPHVKHTIGLAGRLGGPDWYISIIDNTRNHGPGGQGNYNLAAEADPAFGKVTSGFDVIESIKKLPVKQGGFKALVKNVDI
eukprot:CAMPEP_0118650046 /NCGR_PEP_ID=MMETSP0785-20121206/10035_1 /TAXON_ID=91992 /ORGANISM="Bolidomonas pacifica, Strain CCMP 1866" /LENGTH=314 /DNA_ID=CAMNT_0006542389 /DNA_START=68 /DNA_END=1009 /DNA_ORIENTATION=-